MTDINVALPDQMKAWADSQVAAGRYVSIDDYVRDLLRRDEDKSRKVARLQAMVDEERSSGIDPRPWREILAELGEGIHAR